MKPLPAPNPSSILSFPDRGPWGDARYPGNSSGFMMLELLAALKPTFVIDVTAGSGTNAEVATSAPEALEKTHWQAKVRQVLYTHPKLFMRTERGVWGLT